MTLIELVPDEIFLAALLEHDDVPNCAAALGIPLVDARRRAADAGWPDRPKVQWNLDELTGDTRPRTAAPPSSRPAPMPATSTRPVHASAPGGTLNGAPAKASNLTVSDLARACSRSDSKRLQNLGAKLVGLAEQITTALREERAKAEAKAKRAEEVAAAQAEVKRLEKALAEARARAVAAGAPGGAQAAPSICPECGAEFPSPQARGAHRRHQHGVTRTPRSATA